MADFNIRSDSVDVEQIMKQIRARIREKRGVDYTEEQIRELATVRLEKFLDPKNLRSDLIEQFRRSRPAIPAEPPPAQAPYEFTDQTLFETHRAALRFIRKLLKPILKLFFNPNPLINVLHTQAQFNVDLLKREQRRKIEFDRSRAEWNALYYEVLHNLVLETTRSSIEIKNLQMRLEALASRLDFSERRVRALEGVVQYRPEALGPRTSGGGGFDATDGEAAGDGSDTSSGAQPQGVDGLRRRRRRRRRRAPGAPSAASVASEADERGGEPFAEAALSSAVEGLSESPAGPASVADSAFDARDREGGEPGAIRDVPRADEASNPDDEQ